MSNRRILWTGSFVLLAAVNGSTGQIDATTSAPYDVSLSFMISGRISSIHVSPGSKVTAGQSLVDLDDHEHQALLELNRHEAETDVDVRVAAQRL